MNEICDIKCKDCPHWCPCGTDGKPHCLLVETKDGKSKPIIDDRDFRT